MQCQLQTLTDYSVLREAFLFLVSKTDNKQTNNKQNKQMQKGKEAGKKYSIIS